MAFNHQQEARIMELITEGVSTSASRMAAAIKDELAAMYADTQTLVEETRASHQVQLDHVQKTNVEQEAYLNKKHGEIQDLLGKIEELRTSTAATTSKIQTQMLAEMEGHRSNLNNMIFASRREFAQLQRNMAAAQESSTRSAAHQWQWTLWKSSTIFLGR